MVFRHVKDLGFHVAAWTSIFVFVLDKVGSIGSVTGRSMQPTLNPDSNKLARDLVLLNKFCVPSRAWTRGSLVTLRSPTNPTHIVVKRIIGIENDLIIPDHRTKFSTRARLLPGQPIKIPVGYVWVEGDTGMHSIDSNEYGPVPIGLITSKVSAILWPPSRIHFVKSPSLEDNEFGYSSNTLVFPNS